MTEASGAWTGATGGTRSRPLRLLRKILFSEYLVLYFTLFYIAAIWPFVPEIVSPTNLEDVFLQVLPLFIAAIGIIFRGAAYALRGQLDSGTRLARLTENLFALSSVLTPFALGTVIGAIASYNGDKPDTALKEATLADARKLAGFTATEAWQEEFNRRFEPAE